MTGFIGFPAGKNPYVPMPEVFFTVLLPQIEDVAELKVTLHLFWLLAQKQGNPRCVSDRELMADEMLLRGLKRRGDPRPAEDRLRQGLEQAVIRGTLLRILLRLLSDITDEEEVVGWYFFNTPRNRKIVQELQRTEMVPVSMLATDEQAEQAEQVVDASIRQYTSSGYSGRLESARGHVLVERPNIYVLYEQNIGLLGPLIAAQLDDAAAHYPAEWIEAAFSEAVQRNKRNWKYISAILQRWEIEGRH
jgi:DNA replication protein